MCSKLEVERRDSYSLRRYIYKEIRTISGRGQKYFLRMTTSEERYNRVYILKTRDNLNGYFDSYMQCIEIRLNSMFGRFHTETVREFLQMRPKFDKIGMNLITFSACVRHWLDAERYNEMSRQINSYNILLSALFGTVGL